MSHFCLLSEPQSYVAQDWDLLTDHDARAHWLELFSGHFEQTLKHAAMQYGRKAGKAIAAAGQQFRKVLDELRVNPAALPGGKLTVLDMCRAREKTLRDNGLNDPFGYIKIRENLSAEKLYPQVVRKLHSMESAEKWMHLVECVFAGNIFDLGATATMNFASEPSDFLSAVENTKPRPWLVDDFDRLAQDLDGAPPTKWSKAVVFVDNAGSDFTLGVMPLARELALCGTKIVLAANELPSLNDITADETVAVVERLGGADDDLAALISGGMFEVVSTGNDVPLIDLSHVSDELNEAAADADLVVIEGMGRAIESNFNAAFKVDALKLALLKDARVAQRVNGQLYDCVCRYEPVADAAKAQQAVNAKGKLLALDIDGTLVGLDQIVSPEIARALASAQDAGMLVCLATGRSLAESLPIWKQLPLRPPFEPMVAIGGAMVVDPVTGRTLYHRAIERGLAWEFADALAAAGHCALAFVDGWRHGVDYFVSETGDVQAATRMWFSKMNVRIRRLASLRDCPDMPQPLRINAVAPAEQSLELAERLKAQFAGRLNVHAILAPNYGVTIVEAFSPEADKFNAVSYVAQAHRIGPGGIVAVGDDINDLPMIRKAGLGVAFDHSPPAVRQAAHHVASNGLAAFLDDLVAGKFQQGGGG